MKLLLLLALLFGAVSALHLRTETSKFESLLGDKTLPQDGEMPEQEADKSPTRELALQEEEEERGSGSEDFPQEEEPVELVSALAEVDNDFQCPKEEDTVKLVGSPGCKACRFLLVRSPRNFNHAQIICQRCYRGNLVSIHSYSFNYQIHCYIRRLNQGQVWIGGRVTGLGYCRRFYWMDGSSWNFAYWAPGQPWAGRGSCVALSTQGGRWCQTYCGTHLPFICSY
ncbi:bone marrow proteoglycan isoform X1 [Trichechus manatus latirostris]|uniref:Bone marrow proteoglycan isoform X1 n=1 Tax=Trichechus manatus latirostris TaxID=127582 RepID=A0A2Y9E957_TRIMA|nr:bone marrow proteoglycan isoform X1 [Trichechus manatus latirostris]